ncbi:MAG: enoyl-CoA hydratase/isomerase family protein, partial [Acidobacteriota bacterium]
MAGPAEPSGLHHVRVETGRVARLVLDRPPVNVMHLDMLAEMNQGLDSIAAADPAVVVIEATGRTFSAGVDIADHTGDRIEQMLASFHDVFRRLDRLPAPVIAVVQGAALGGGCELATACDLVVAARGATFGQPEIRLGAFPPVAAVELPRVMPPRRAAEMLFTGEALSADEAAAAGLVNRVHDDATFRDEAEAFIGLVSRHSAVVLALTKAALRMGRGRPLHEALPDVECLYLDRLMQTHDAREGITAFMEKRPPVFSDA